MESKKCSKRGCNHEATKEVASLNRSYCDVHFNEFMDKKKLIDKKAHEKYKQSDKYKAKMKRSAEKRKNNPDYIAKNRERSMAYYHKAKETEQFRQRERARGKKRYAEMDTENNFSFRYTELKSSSKKFGVNCSIKLEELENILKNEKCYLTGIKISEHLKETKSAYYLDRIGKKEYGGDGRRGGDYVLDNVKPCIFKVNELRDILDLNCNQAKVLFYPARIYLNIKNIVNKIKKMFKIV